METTLPESRSEPAGRKSQSILAVLSRAPGGRILFSLACWVAMPCWVGRDDEDLRTAAGGLRGGWRPLFCLESTIRFDPPFGRERQQQVGKSVDGCVGQNDLLHLGRRFTCHPDAPPVSCAPRRPDRAIP